MRKWLGLTLIGGIATAAGCGGGGSDGTGFAGDDSGSTTDDAGMTGSDGSIPTLDGGHDASSGDDATTGNDGSSASDSTLDINFPDGFTVPDSSAPDTGMVVDTGTPCSPNGVTCNGNIATTCTNGVTTVATCGGTTPLCADGFGCVVCAPGSGSCSSTTGTVCKSDGSGYQTNNCDPLLGLTCSGGYCQGDCANIGQSYIGCEYYSVTMSNSQLDQATFIFTVSISNTGASTASINIAGPSGFSQSDTIVAGGIKEYTLPWVPALSKNGMALTQKVAGGAYHIRSTEPVTVYQFNARDYTRGGAFSYTNDASLLLPVNAMTGNYYVASGATWYFSGGIQFPGTVAVIGTVDNTTVTYTAPSGNPIIAGAGLTTTGGTFTLNKGDVVQIESAQNAGAINTFGSDQSGAHIVANQPVEVFGGSDCTNMPASIPACDHLEEVMFPLETLRSDYLITLPYNENGTPAQYVKIIGTQAGTTITTDPTGLGAPATLGAGQSSFFHVTSNFRVTSSAPILIGQFMESENNFTATATAGDPAMTTAVATAQYRTSYQFVAPPNYQENWLNVVAPSGASITVDGVAVPTGTAIGSSGYWVQKVSLCANNTVGCTGVHKAAGSAAFGIQVYGYGSYTSYWYPGGLDLKRQ